MTLYGNVLGTTQHPTPVGTMQQLSQLKQKFEPTAFIVMIYLNMPSVGHAEHSLSANQQLDAGQRRQGTFRSHRLATQLATSHF